MACDGRVTSKVKEREAARVARSELTIVMVTPRGSPALKDGFTMPWQVFWLAGHGACCSGLPKALTRGEGFSGLVELRYPLTVAGTASVLVPNGYAAPSSLLSLQSWTVMRHQRSASFCRKNVPCARDQAAISCTTATGALIPPCARVACRVSQESGERLMLSDKRNRGAQ